MIIELKEDKSDLFKDYLRHVKTSFDDYFLSESMINTFKIHDNFTLLYMKNDKIIGLISVMKSYGTRLRIIDGPKEILKDLHLAMIQLLNNNQLKSYKAFIDLEDKDLLEFYDKNLIYERSIYALERPPEPIKICHKNFNIRPLEMPGEKDLYAHIRNQAFQPVKGFESRDGDFYKDMHTSKEYVKEWTLVLSSDHAIGIIKAAKEIENGRIQAYIGPIAILPEYQGKGYGKYLLSHLIDIINKEGYVCTLSVNVDNEKALKLYYDLGFKNTKIVKAYI